MIVDSSALIAILFAEPEAGAFVNAIENAPQKFIAAPTLLEANIVAIGRAGLQATNQLSDIVERLRIKVLPFTEDYLPVAKSACQRYGKGHGHRAQLNFGDCISYAVSKLEMMPLLFKGNDFRFTDVECAL